MDDTGVSAEQRNLIVDLQVEAGREKIHGSYGRQPLCSRGPKQHRPARQGHYKWTPTDLYDVEESCETLLVSVGGDYQKFSLLLCQGSRHAGSPQARSQVLSLKRNIVSQEQGFHDFKMPALGTKYLAAAMAAGAVDAAARFTHSG